MPIRGALRPMRMGLLTAEGAENVLTVKTFIGYCRKRITDGTVPGIRIGTGSGA